MKKIFITGSSGFVGISLKSLLSRQFEFSDYNRSTFPEINHDVVIHLAGKAHDLKNIVSYDEYYKHPKV